MDCSEPAYCCYHGSLTGPGTATGLTRLAVTQSEFWQFSVTLYALPGVAEHCLTLQDKHGLDVNLVLFCIWYGRQFGEVPEALLNDALSISADWRNQVVNPLRTVRTQMKQNTGLTELFADSGYDELREAIKRVELKSERIQQEKLEAMASQYSSENKNAIPGAEETNLRALCSKLGVSTSVLQVHTDAIISASKDL